MHRGTLCTAWCQDRVAYPALTRPYTSREAGKQTRTPTAWARWYLRAPPPLTAQAQSAWRAQRTHPEAVRHELSPARSAPLAGAPASACPSGSGRCQLKPPSADAFFSACAGFGTGHHCHSDRIRVGGESWADSLTATEMETKTKWHKARCAATERQACACMLMHWVLSRQPRASAVHGEAAGPQSPRTHALSAGRVGDSAQRRRATTRTRQARCTPAAQA